MNGRQLTATVWQHAPSRYGGTALLVLLKVAGLSAKGGHSYASVAYLAQACGATPRAISKVLKTLRKDGIVRVQHRKGHSSKIFVNWEAVQALPLALPPNEEQTASEEEAAPQPSDEEKDEAPTPQHSDAQTISGLLRDSFVNANVQPPSDWQTAWPIEFQKLLDGGYTVDVIRSIARFALGVVAYREEIHGRGPVVLSEKFALLQEQAKTFGKAAT